LGIAPYGGFINPRMTAVLNEAGEMVDAEITYVEDFTEQMLDYAERFTFLPQVN
jgi:dipeptidyl-peptidase-3